ncbi:MAG: hypothetical protein WDM96_02335 [Lacunisphaera sp.]
MLDADALRGEVVELVKDRPFIGTPHAGEFERIAPNFSLTASLPLPTACSCSRVRSRG